MRGTKTDRTFDKELSFKRVWLTDEKTKECEDFLSAASSLDRIIFIANDGPSARNVVRSVHYQCAVKVIFIIRSSIDDADFDDWAKSYIKIRSVPSVDALASQIEDFESRWLRTVNDFFSINIFQANSSQCDQSSVELNGSFLFMQLFLDVLLRMTPLSTDKDELVVECMKEYKDHPKILEHIQDFSDYYKPNTALFWYTRQTFLYPLLNKALRVENIDILYLFRFFMRDIRDQLAGRQCTSPVKVHRGQLMSSEELARLKSLFFQRRDTTITTDSRLQTIYICMKSFFSTSLERNVAEIYVADQPEADTCFVLFEIDADPSVCTQNNAFAILGQSSAIPNEEEVLFMMNCIFRLTDICEEGNKCVISLELCSNNDDAFKDVFEYLKNDYGGAMIGYKNEATLNSFATVLFNMNKYDLADRFFRRYYNELPEWHRDRARCSHNIGNAAFQLGKYRESRRWLYRALNLCNQSWPPGHPVCVPTHHCIGALYERKRKHRQAINAYETGLAVVRNYYGDEHTRVALFCAAIGRVYFEKNNFEQAIALFQKALLINEKCLHPLHPDLVRDHRLLGLTLSHNGQRNLALQHYEKALTIGLKTVTSNSTILALIHNETGMIYRDMGNIEKATDHFQKAVAIENHHPLRAQRQLNSKINYICSRCHNHVWAYTMFDRIKESPPVCFIFHSKLASCLGDLCQ